MSDANEKARGAATSLAYRIGMANLAAGITGVGASFILKSSFASGFAIGYTIGVVNIFWLLNIARKGVRLTPERAGKLVTRNYYMRFLATAVIFSVLIGARLLSPWPLVAGLTLSIFTTIIVTILAAREESRCTT